MLKIFSADIGAGSGRFISTSFDGKKLNSEEVYRFTNSAIKLGGTIYWDILNIMNHLKKGILKSKSISKDPDCMGIDTWGADFGLLDKNGKLLSNPVSYRDPRNSKGKKLVLKKISLKNLNKMNSSLTYDHCTLFQLNYLYNYEKDLAMTADKLLFIPNLINYFLTGQKILDETILSGSQFFNVEEKKYLEDVLDLFRIPKKIFSPVKASGTVIGKLGKQYENELNIKNCKVAMVCSHDSASAVTGIPLDKKTDSCFINSGTWSVIGTETIKPINEDKIYENDFTNWCAFRDYYMIVKIFSGFYFLQELKKLWDTSDRKVSEYSSFYSGITTDSKTSALIDLESGILFDESMDMEKRIAKFLNSSGQNSSIGRKEIIISLLHSITLEYRLALDELEMVTDKEFPKIFMVGGGSLNKVFCQWVSNCLSKDVYAGYPESTINGNVITQLFALGEISSIEEGRQIIKNSSKEKIYTPKKDKNIWDKLLNEYIRIKRRKEDG